MFPYCNGKKSFIFVDHGIVSEISVVVYWKRSFDPVLVSNSSFGNIGLDLFCYWTHPRDIRRLGQRVGNNWDNHSYSYIHTARRTILCAKIIRDINSYVALLKNTQLSILRDLLSLDTYNDTLILVNYVNVFIFEKL